MSKKKKIVLISVLSVLAALLIVAAILIGLIFRPANIPEREDLGFETVCYELPDDNDPMSHTGIENIGYMNWRLQHQTYWYSEAHVFVDNPTDDQNVATYKQYHDGVLISTDISKSNLVNKAMQYCQVRGGNVVLFRSSTGGKSKFNGINTPWDTGKPDGHTVAEYKVKKGLPPLEFSVYILNENTVKEYSDVVDNGNGTYSQTFILNFESEPAEKDATYWYKTEMAYKANGMMKEDPQFSEVKITYTFDDTWQVISTQTREVYKTITGVGPVNCVAEGTTEYTYNNTELTYNAEFENYYVNYFADYEVPEDIVIDGALCLAEAFGGVTQGESKLALDLTLGENRFGGNIQLNLDQNDVRVDLGDIKVYMRTEGSEEQYLYVSYGQNIKAKICLSDITSVMPATEAETDEGEGVLDKLLAALGDDECFTLAEDKRSATLEPTIDLGELLGVDLDITVHLNFKFNISEQNEITLDCLKADGNVLGMQLNAELRFTDEGVAALTQAEAAEYTAISSDLVPAIQNLLDVISKQQLSVTGSLEVGGVAITLDNLAISWANGVDVKAQLTLNLDSFQKTIYLEYNEEKIALYYDGIVVELLQSEVEGFASSVQELYEAIAAEVNAGESVIPDTIDLEKILSLITPDGDGEGEVPDIFGILDALTLFESEQGNLSISYGDLTFELLLDGQGGIGAGVTYAAEDGFEIAANVCVTEYRDVKLPANCSKLDVAELGALFENITQILVNKGITVSGNMLLGDNEIALTLYGLSVSWADGIELQLDARIEANGSAHDFYAEYSAKTGALKIVYGALDGGAGINININEDAQTLEDALVSLYNRIAEVVNTMSEGGDVMSKVDSLNELLDLISGGKDAVGEVAALAEALDEIETAQPSIGDILASIEIKSENGKLSFELGGITLTLWRADDKFNISLFAASVGIEITDAQIIATEATDFNIEVVNALSAEDVADVFDYIAATVELLVTDTLKIELSGTITSTEEAYAEIENNVKYTIDAGFEYVQGESGFPVHVKPETTDEEGNTQAPDFWIAPDIYVHLYVNMLSTLPQVDSVIFDAYIFDGTPAIGSDGKTTADELTSGDNELDVYVSVSRIPSEQANNEINGASEPLKIYAPMNEIMTVLSAGLALVDVGSISIDALPELNGIIVQIGSILDTMLVDRYLGDTKDQFVSLGAGLIETILGGSISDMLNDLINGMLGSAQPDVEEEQPVALSEEVDEGFNRVRQGLINLNMSRDEEGTSTLTLVVGETETKVTKESTEKGSRLTGLTVDKSVLNETDTLNNLGISLKYEGIEKVNSLEGYTGFVGADELVKALINSATHEEIVDDSNTYVLNNSFFIDGEVSLEFLGMSFMGATIYIDGVSVNLENGVEIDIRLHYNKSGLSALVFNASSTVDISIKNNMVYMRRVAGNETIYRAMPMEVFTSDIMNQIKFILNFTSTIANLFPEESEGGEGLTYKQDYGEQLKDYLNSFSVTESSNSASWAVTLNGTGINRLAGMDNLISDGAKVIFNAIKDETAGYVIQSLGIDATLLKVFKVSGTLNWQNPQENWRSDSAKTTSESIVANNPSLTVAEWLGGTSIEEIRNVTDWDNLPDAATVKSTDEESGEAIEQRLPYFQLTFVGGNANVLDDNITSTLKLRRKDFYYRTTIHGLEEEYISSVYVLSADGVELTYYTTPDENDYALEHSTPSWSVQTVGNVERNTVIHIPNKYTVKFSSEHAHPDNGTEWSYEHSYGTVLAFDFSAEIKGGKNDIWYRVDYLLCNGMRYTAENIHELEIIGETEIEVYWKEIPHATVTVVSDKPIEGFEETDGVWSKDFEIESGADVNLAGLVGEIDEVEGYVFGGFTLTEDAEETSDIVNIDGDTTVYVKWISPEISVIYYSSLQINGDYVAADAVDGYDTVYSFSATYSADKGFAADQVSYDGYQFLGWYYNDPVNGWMLVNNVKDDISGSDKYSTPVELHAVWVQAIVIESETYGSKSGRNYTMHVGVSVKFYGNQSLLAESSMEISTVDLTCKVGTYSDKATKEISRSGAEFTIVGSATRSALLSYSNWNLDGSVKVNFNGIEKSLSISRSNITF